MLMICIPVDSAIAQIHEKDPYATLAPGDQVNPTITRPAQEDFTIVVWEDHNGNGVDIFAMKVDNVNGLPMWGEFDGMPVCQASGDQGNPRAAYDSLGNVVVVWEDYRDGNQAHIFAQALYVSDGTKLPNWPTNGLAICDLDSHAERPRIVGSIDGVFIAWVDWRNSPDPPDDPQRDIYLQFISTVDADYPQGAGFTWQANGKPVPINLDSDQINVELARDYIWKEVADQPDRSGVILVYQDKRHNGATTGQPVWNIYADRYNAYGGWEWGDEHLDLSYEDQTMPQLVVTGQLHGEGATMALVCWQDDRSDPGVSTAWDIRAQVVNRTDGSTPPGSGFAICNHDDAQQLPELALYEYWVTPNDPTTYHASAICVYEDDRSVQTATDVYYSAVDLVNASLYNANTNDGDVVCALGGDQRQVRVDAVRSEGAANVIWQHNAGTNGDEDIMYQSIDFISLQTRWTSGAGKVVTEAKFEQANPQVGGNVFAWADARRELWGANIPEDWNIHLQTPGECVGPTDMAWRDVFAEVRQTGDASQMRFATDAENNTFVVWKKSTGTAGEYDIYVQRLDVHGVPRWTNSGIPLAEGAVVDHPAITISDVVGGAQVVWEQMKANGQIEIWYARISPAGVVVDGPEMLITDPIGGTDDCTNPMIVYTAITVDPDPLNSGTIVPIYPAYFGFIFLGKIWYAVKDVAAAPASSNQVSPPSGTIWTSIEKMVSPPGEHLYLVGTGVDPASNPEWLGMYARFTNALDFVAFSPPVAVDFGGIDLALDSYDVGGSQDAIVVVASNAGANGAQLEAYWMSVQPNPLHYGGIIEPTTASNERISHPRLAPDNQRAPNSYGGMMVVWDYEYPVMGVQKHKLRTDKLIYNPAQTPQTINWCPTPAHLPPGRIDVAGPYNTASEPEIARINAPNDLDTLAFITWEGLTEICSPTRPREVVGNWVAYNFYPVPNRGPQWSSEKALSPGGGNYTQTKPLVQTSDGNTVRLYWIDGRGAGDLVMSTRLRGAEGDAIYWLKDVADEQQPVPVHLRLGESYPNPLSLRGGGLSHVAVEVDREQFISLKIHDALGREVAVVYEGMLPTGKHVLRLDASVFSPGTYYYVLRADGILATRGVVLVR